jgi:hypothetical protein
LKDAESEKQMMGRFCGNRLLIEQMNKDSKVAEDAERSNSEELENRSSSVK